MGRASPTSLKEISRQPVPRRKDHTQCLPAGHPCQWILAGPATCPLLGTEGVVRQPWAGLLWVPGLWLAPRRWVEQEAWTPEPHFPLPATPVRAPSALLCLSVPIWLMGTAILPSWNCANQMKSSVGLAMLFQGAWALSPGVWGSPSGKVVRRISSKERKGNPRTQQERRNSR